MSVTLGAITIGQSPRTDFTEDIRDLLDPGIRLKEIGLLDGFDYGEASRRFAPADGEPILVSRMRDGTGIRLSEKKMVDRMREVVSSESSRTDAILVLCTGRFPEVVSDKPVFFPQTLLQNTVRGLAGGRPVGLLVPEDAQKEPARRLWASSGVDVRPLAASPYTDPESRALEAAVRQHDRDGEIRYVVMDCMGYSAEMKRRARTWSGKLFILPRTLIVRVVNELLG